MGHGCLNGRGYKAAIEEMVGINLFDENSAIKVSVEIEELRASTKTGNRL